MKVVGYARVSTELQREKETIKTQQEAIKAYCAQNGYELLGIYSDENVYSKTLLGERPQGKLLMEAARRHEFKAVIVYKADRLGRDELVGATLVKELYKELGILVFGTAENIDLASTTGMMMFSVNSAFANKQLEDDLRRSYDATTRLVKEGAWQGGICPFGYRVVGRNGKARLEPADVIISSLGKSEADVVRWIYEMSAKEGLTCVQIAKRLNAHGVQTSYARDDREVTTNQRKQKTQGLWSSGRIRNMIVETTYKGIHKWGKRPSKKRRSNKIPKIYEREVPALVDEETWQQAQNTLAKNRLVRPDAKRRPYLLRTLIKCAHCGLTYCGRPNPSISASKLPYSQVRELEVKDGRVIVPYYFCNGTNHSRQLYRKDGEKCHAVSVNGHELENLVWNDLVNYLQNPPATLEQLREILEEKSVDKTSLQETRAKLASRLAEMQTRREKIVRLWSQDRITDEMLDLQLKGIDEEESPLKVEIQRLEDELLTVRDEDASLLTAENIIATLQTKLEGQLSWETKREIVEALVEGIVVNTEVIEGKKRPRVTVNYKFDQPCFIPKSAKAKIGTDVHAVTYSAK